MLLLGDMCKSLKYDKFLLVCRTELIRRMKRFGVAKYRCLLVKYAKDTRYDDFGVATHDRYIT